MRVSGDLVLNVLSAPRDACEGLRNGIRAVHAGELDALVVTGVYPHRDLDEVVRRLETDGGAFPTSAFPPHNRGAILGPCIDLCGPDLAAYLEEVPRMRAACDAVFRHTAAFETRVQEVLSQLSSSLPVRLLESEGRPYAPATVRRLEPGGYVKLHTEDEKIDQPQKRHLAAVAKPGIMSFYLMLQPPLSGGELVLHELRWRDYDGRMYEGRSDAVLQVEGKPRAHIALEVGDLVVFGSGRFHEVTEVGPGRARWTMGGFLALGAANDAVYFYS
jgi:hypothetical protein